MEWGRPEELLAGQCPFRATELKLAPCLEGFPHRQLVESRVHEHSLAGFGADIPTGCCPVSHLS